jgi:hypothetical protein
VIGITGQTGVTGVEELGKEKLHISLQKNIVYENNLPNRKSRKRNSKELQEKGKNY